MSTAIKQVEVQATDNTETQPKLAEGVSIKVADSRKCVSIYGITTERLPVNFTVEQFDRLNESWEAVRCFVEANRDKLLTKEERKFENKQAKAYSYKEEQKQKGMDESKDLLLALQILKAMRSK